MHRLAFRVDASRKEEVLDALLPLLPGGVHEDGEELVTFSALPLDRAALVGCAVTTGVGAVFNTAKVEPGSSVAVFGCGGVGLNVVQGAAIAGAERIIAIDTMESKLAMAKQFGATDTILAKPGEDIAKALKKLTGGGPDYAFECVGAGALAETAYRAIRRGGKAVIDRDIAKWKPLAQKVGIKID